jgi:uncharacterized protein YggE
MKKQILLVIGLLIIPLISANAQWHSDQPPPQINVSGSAEVKVAPDEVDLSVAVESRDVNLDAAKRKNDEHIASALKFLKSENVPDKHVQTDYISIGPVYNERGDANVDSRVTPMYYIVRRNIGIKLSDVTTFDKILAGLLANGVNDVAGINFQTTQLRKYKDQVRAMAIKAAKEKAEAMAGELGVKVGKPYNISVSDSTAWPNFPQARFAFAGGGGGAGGEAGVPTLAVGQISVSATVNVVFLIQ